MCWLLALGTWHLTAKQSLTMSFCFIFSGNLPFAKQYSKETISDAVAAALDFDWLDSLIPAQQWLN
jgi:hypothetical protein